MASTNESSASGQHLLKAAAYQALGRTAPAHLEQALWQQTAALLRQRRD
ncbi:hypothetical protein [Pimelobacter simplex]|nr:hypothetical protein [Pimelobacter simplex]UUW88597.1 hypothetical protein M0M43_23075 [Pimelobacter simplex]UUW98102.1 hypothetical protein M0M48_11725 [Pimelobacter simplex]